MIHNMYNYIYMYNVPYSRKYWRELNLVVGSQIAIANVLADLNLVVRYGITIRIYASKKFLAETAKPPNLIPHQAEVPRDYLICMLQHIFNNSMGDKPMMMAYTQVTWNDFVPPLGRALDNIVQWNPTLWTPLKCGHHRLHYIIDFNNKPPTNP